MSVYDSQYFLPHSLHLILEWFFGAQESVLIEYNFSSDILCTWNKSPSALKQRRHLMILLPYTKKKSASTQLFEISHEQSSLPHWIIPLPNERELPKSTENQTRRISRARIDDSTTKYNEPRLGSLYFAIAPCTAGLQEHDFLREYLIQRGQR